MLVTLPWRLGGPYAPGRAARTPWSLCADADGAIWLDIADTRTETFWVATPDPEHPGVYGSPLNLEHTITPELAGATWVDTHNADWCWSRYNRSAYGVADTVDQVLAYYAEPVADRDRQFVIEVTLFDRADEPPTGGWHWCKWGVYIGAHEPQAAYLADEPEIERILVFHLWEVRLTPVGDPNPARILPDLAG